MEQPIADQTPKGGEGGLIKETTTQGFMADVMEASREVLVLVDFWAPWCEPCKQLGPMLEKLVMEMGGLVRMVKINVDENKDLAAQMQVQSIPAVYAFRDGRPVDSFAGALPESQIRAFIKRLTGDAKGPLPEALDAAAAAVGASPPKTYIHRLAPRDWAAENLTLFPPLRIGRYFICPTHYRGAVPPGSVSLRLNPGAAFGSGEHASTSGCLRALDWLARRRRFHKALDLGCGSGILAMAMAATWRIGVVAADLDQRAVMVARDNARLNQMTRLVGAVQSNGYRSSAVRRGAPYDLIVCNILANSLKAMAKDLGRHLSKNGAAVLSGFYARDAAAVLAAHRAQGLRLMRRFDQDGWRTLALMRGRAH